MERKKLHFTANVFPDDQSPARIYHHIPVEGWVTVLGPDEPPIIDRLTIYSPGRDEGHGITRTVLRVIADEIEHILVQAMHETGLTQPGVRAEEEFRRRRGLVDPVQRRELGESHLARIADAYREAEAAGHSGLRYIMRTFNCSKSTAARWIAEARKTGLLEPRERK